jgi:signal transduction histidine kinase/streptogramin lyase
MVGTLGAGMVWFDADGGRTTLATTNGLSSDFILSMCVDREGTLWVGTDGGGMNRVKRQLFDVLPQSRAWTVQSVAETSSGGLWIGCNSGELQLWQDGALLPFRTTPPAMLAPSVRAVYSDRDQSVFVGTIGLGLLQLRGTNFVPVTGPRVPFALQRVVQAIHQDRDGRHWFGTQNGIVGREPSGWASFSTTNGLSSDDVRAIADDRQGNLWIGTRGGGLNRLHDGIFTYFHKHDGLPGEDINSLLVDEDDVLWVGTSSGLARLKAGRWTQYTSQDGLISNTVGYLVEDGLGYLWIGSNGGLMRVPKAALNDFAEGRSTYVAVRTYRTPDGLPTSECTFGSQPAAIRDRNGTLWFPTIKGLVSVDPRQLHPNTNPPPVVIESVLVEGQAQNTNALRADFGSSLTVPAGRERIEIHYTSLNLAAPEAARFQYRLEGHESEWIEAGNTRVARYSKLPPGEYRFHVKACNEDGVWNETGSSVALIIEPPFWRTWWFLALAVTALLGLIVAVVHYFSTQKLQRQLEGLRQQEALEKERARIARDIHDQLGANLTQVALLGELVESDKGSPEDVEAHARQISQTARDTTRSLDEIVWTVNPSNDTVDGLVTYLCKYAQDYFEVAGLRYRLDVPAQLPGNAIPPEVRHNVFLAAKEAINNVVKHAQATAAILRLRLEPGAFVLEIQDDGRGLSGMESKTTRNGLRNMRKRMQDVGGEFSIGPAPERGTIVRLLVPIRGG